MCTAWVFIKIDINEAWYLWEFFNEIRKVKDYKYVKSDELHKKKLIIREEWKRKYKREKINIENQQHDRQVWNEVDKVDNIVRHNTNEHNGTSIINWNNFGKIETIRFSTNNKKILFRDTIDRWKMIQILKKLA